MTEQTPATAAPAPKPAPKEYKYLVTWWAEIPTGYRTGREIVTCTRPIQENDLSEGLKLDEYIRTKAGYPTAFVTAFSRFGV